MKVDLSWFNEIILKLLFSFSIKFQNLQREKWLNLLSNLGQVFFTKLAHFANM
jgi:hypothetical protein